MVNISNFSQWIQTYDIKQGKEFGRIVDVKAEAHDEYDDNNQRTGNKVDKLVLYGKTDSGVEKPKILNNTELKSLGQKFGGETDEWKNKSILYKVVTQQVRGNTIESVRIEPVLERSS